MQLAGGTNAATLEFLRPTERPAGIAFGGVARRLLMPVLDEAQTRGCPVAMARGLGACPLPRASIGGAMAAALLLEG